MADHNDPNAVNSIFSDIDVSAADVYDMFGYPSDDRSDGERVVIALTFASVPTAGVFDTDMLYRLQVTTAPRPVWPDHDPSLHTLLEYVGAVKDKYLGELRAAEVRVTADAERRAKVDFLNFPGGSFSVTVDLDSSVTHKAPDGSAIRLFLGGRDDAFFNDLPGFFRSINYAPQFYHVPHTCRDLRELPIPKTLLELEGNHLFNFDPDDPARSGDGEKSDLPAGPAHLGRRPVREGRRRQLPLRLQRRRCPGRQERERDHPRDAAALPDAPARARPDRERVGRELGAEGRQQGRDDPRPSAVDRASVGAHRRLKLDDELKRYKLVDTVGQPFADAGLSEREDNRQLGANNFWLAPHFVKRLAHLGWGFGPSITALGLATSFDHDNSPVSVHRTYSLAATAFPRVRKADLPAAQHARRLLESDRRSTYRFAGRSRSSSPTSARSTWTRPARGRSDGGSRIRWRRGSCRCSSTWRPGSTAGRTTSSR